MSRFNDLYIKKLLIRGTSTSIGSAYEKIYQSSYLTEHEESSPSKSNVPTPASIEHQKKIVECCEEFNRNARELKIRRLSSGTDESLSTATVAGHENGKSEKRQLNELSGQTPTKVHTSDHLYDFKPVSHSKSGLGRLHRFQDSVRKRLFGHTFQWNRNRSRSAPTQMRNQMTLNRTIQESQSSSNETANAHLARSPKSEVDKLTKTTDSDNERANNQSDTKRTSAFGSSLRAHRDRKRHLQLAKCMSDPFGPGTNRSAKANRRRHSIDHRYSKALANAFSKSAFYQLTGSIDDIDWSEDARSNAFRVNTGMADSKSPGQLLNRSCWSVTAQPTHPIDCNSNEAGTLEMQTIQRAASSTSDPPESLRSSCLARQRWKIAGKRVRFLSKVSESSN